MDLIEEYKIENDRRMSLFNTKQKHILVMMCIERQFKAYQKMAQGKDWNRSKEYRQLLDECWRISLDEKGADESIWNMHEAIKPEYLNKSIDANTLEFCYANIFASNVEEVLVNLLDENGYEETFRLLNLDYIITFLNEDNQFYDPDPKDNELIIREKKRQAQDEKDMDIICCFNDARKWYDQCESLI